MMASVEIFSEVSGTRRYRCAQLEGRRLNERQAQARLALIYGRREPNGERQDVVSSPSFSLRWLEPRYGTGGSIWRLQALKSGNSVENSINFTTAGSVQRREGVSEDKADILAVLSIL